MQNERGLRNIDFLHLYMYGTIAITCLCLLCTYALLSYVYEDVMNRLETRMDLIGFRLFFFFFTKCPCCVNSLLGCVHSRNVPYAMGIRLNTCKNAGHRLQLFSTFGLLSAVCLYLYTHFYSTNQCIPA